MHVIRLDLRERAVVYYADFHGARSRRLLWRSGYRLGSMPKFSAPHVAEVDAPFRKIRRLQVLGARHVAWPEAGIGIGVTQEGPDQSVSARQGSADVP